MRSLEHVDQRSDVCSDRVPDHAADPSRRRAVERVGRTWLTKLLARRRAPLLAGVLVSLAAFVPLSATAARSESFWWDRAIFRLLYSGESEWPLGGAPRHRPVLTELLPFLSRISQLTTLALVAGAICLGLILRGRLRAAAVLVLAAAFAGITPVLKDAFERPSPFPLPGDHSFPSGHAMLAMTLAGGTVLLLARTRWRWFSVVAASVFVVALSVPAIADGGHWPSDVLGSWLLAGAWIGVLGLVVREPLGSRSAEVREPLAGTATRPAERSPAVQRLAAGLKEAICAAIRWSGLACLVRRTYGRRRAAILLYHDPDPQTLDRHLAYLRRRYAFVSLSQLVDAIQGGRWSSLPRRALAITLDDGHRGNAVLREIFRRHGVTPTIYLCTQVVATDRHFWFFEAGDTEALKHLPNRERLARLKHEGGFENERSYPGDRQAMSAEEIASMKDAVEFGSHTRFHPVLTTCDDGESEREIFIAKGDVESLVGDECRHFSFPNGDYGERELALVRAAGYASARTVDYGWNNARTDPFQLRILGTPDDASINRLAADLAGISGYLGRVRRGSLSGKHIQVVKRRRV